MDIHWLQNKVAFYRSQLNFMLELAARNPDAVDDIAEIVGFLKTEIEKYQIALREAYKYALSHKTN